MAVSIRVLDVLEAASSGEAARRVYEELQRLDSLITALQAKTYYITDEGGISTDLINNTGVPTVRGTVVRACTVLDRAFLVAPADSVEPVGIVYDDGVAQGSLCRVVVAGRAQVLVKDGVSASNGNWVSVSDVAGRADTSSAAPNPVTHFAEIGHCLESTGPGVDVLAFISVHFN
jgi:hypothetical protein